MTQNDTLSENSAGEDELFPVEAYAKDACGRVLAAFIRERLICPSELVKLVRQEFRATEAAIVAEGCEKQSYEVLLSSSETPELAWDGTGWPSDPSSGTEVSQKPTAANVTIAWFPLSIVAGQGRRVALVLVDAVLLNGGGRLSHEYGHRVLGWLLKVWTGTVDSLRDSVDRARRELQSGRLTEDARRECCRVIDNAVVDQPKALGARNMFAALRQRMRQHDGTFEPLNATEGAVLLQCWDCPAFSSSLCGRPLLSDTRVPSHHNCAGTAGRRLFGLLVGWTWWCGVGPYEIGPLRGIKREEDKAKDTPRPGSLRDCFASFRKDAAALASDAAASVDPSSLDQRALVRFFFSKALDPDGPGAEALFALFPPSPFPSDEEMACAMKNLASVAHYVFVDIPLDEDTIEAIIWLTSEYLHRALGLPHGFDIKAHLLTAARGEPALHALKNFYRDHFFHALQVCFLGHYVLEQHVVAQDGRVPLWNLVARLLLPAEEVLQHGQQRVLQLWYLAALLHDVAYSIDVEKGAVSLLKKLGKSSPIKDFLGALELATEQLSSQLVAEKFQGYAEKDRPGEDHGVVAARHLANLVESMSAADPSVVSAFYQPAIRAVAVHNSRAHEVSFRDEPLSFLLVLCDTVQEWNRMQFGGAARSVELLARLASTQGRHGEADGPVTRVALLEIPTRKASRGENEPPPGCAVGHGFAFRLDYGDSIQANCGVFNLWIDATCNLQRLRFDGTPDGFDICLEFVTPLHLDGNGQRYPQLYRLRDAARETHMGFLERWFPSEDGGNGWSSNGAIQYGKFTASVFSDAREHLVLDLRKLSERRRVTADIKKFRSSLERWRYYSEDRDYRGDYAMPETLG